MAKIKTLKKQRSSSKKSKPVVLHSHNVLDEKRLNKEHLKSILAEALVEGDFDMLKDVLIAQIRVQNKAEIVRRSKLGRQTLYDLIEDKREFNPTVKTLSSLLKALAA